MKKRVYGIILLLMVLFMTGCWSRREVEELAIVSAISIDRTVIEGQNKYKLGMLVARPPQLGGGQKGPSAIQRNVDWLVSEVGNTLYDAGRNISRRSPRTLVAYHNDLVIIGKEAAKQGVSDILDHMVRHKDIRLRTWIFVSPGEALSSMKALPETEQLLSTEISELLKQDNFRISETYSVDLKMFTEALITPGLDAVTPVVNTMTPPEPAGNQRAPKEPTNIVTLGGLAVFQKEKLVGFLSPVETKGFLYIIGKARSGIIPVKFPENAESKIAFMMTRAKSQLKPVIRNGRLVMEVKIEAEGNVAEVDGKVAVGDPEVIEKLSKKFSESIKSLAEDTLRKAQKKYKADIFGFGNKIHKQYPEYWREIEKDWHDIYPDLPVEIKVEGYIRRTSILADPFEIK